MSNKEFEQMLLFRRIINENGRAIVLDNDVIVENADFTDVELNKRVTLVNFNEDKSIDILNNGKVICKITNAENIEVKMPNENEAAPINLD